MKQTHHILLASGQYGLFENNGKFVYGWFHTLAALFDYCPQAAFCTVKLRG